MDFHAELMKRRDVHFAALGELSYKRHQLIVDQEEMQKQMQMLSNDIQSRERAVGEIDQTLRDFDTYIAVKEGAITLEGLKNAVEQGDSIT